MTLRTRYEFTLPRGYVDREGAVHRTGVMRLATARDELEPLRDPTITGPDDPRLTVVVLARVVERLGALELVTTHEIEGLFAADLAYLQDFYGVINFGTPDEFEQFVAAHQPTATPAPPAPEPEPVHAPTPVQQVPAAVDAEPARPARRSAIEELPAETR